MFNPWNELLIRPILNLLIALYKAFSLLGLPGAFGFAIVGLTVIIRFLLYPLTQAQLKSAKKMQELKPRLDDLTKKHKGDKVKLQQAQLSLYQEAGINPAAGCLPLLIQMPVFIALYNVFIQVLNGGTQGEFLQKLNSSVYTGALKLTSLDLTFFGLNLTVKPNAWQTQGVWLLLIPLVTGGLQYWQTKLMLPAAPAKTEAKEEDQMAGMQRQMSLMMPVMIGFFALSFPVGLALYWNTFSVFGIIQQARLNSKK